MKKINNPSTDENLLMNDELIPLPCPFCGSKNITIEKSSHSKFPNVMACINCWAQSSYEDTPQEAIKAWNTRVESTLEKKLEEAVKALSMVVKSTEVEDSIRERYSNSLIARSALSKIRDERSKTKP